MPAGWRMETDAELGKTYFIPVVMSGSVKTCADDHFLTFAEPSSSPENGKGRLVR
jgi:ABC-type microcin C transport system permease subunit YejE